VSGKSYGRLILIDLQAGAQREWFPPPDQQ
jgi:hypothetical protein